MKAQIQQKAQSYTEGFDVSWTILKQNVWIKELLI